MEENTTIIVIAIQLRHSVRMIAIPAPGMPPSIFKISMKRSHQAIWTPVVTN